VNGISSGSSPHHRDVNGPAVILPLIQLRFCGSCFSSPRRPMVRRWAKNETTEKKSGKEFFLQSIRGRYAVFSPCYIVYRFRSGSHERTDRSCRDPLSAAGESSLRWSLPLHCRISVLTAPAMFLTIAGMWEASFGRSAMMVASRLFTRAPARRALLQPPGGARCSKSPDISGRYRKMHAYITETAAPRSASQTAWSNTSASEWRGALVVRISTPPG